MGYPLQAIHVPKTVDNDLPITDCCPGFGSVAKYVAVSALEASFDVRSMARTSTKVFVLEVMGRHAGWIAAAGGLIEEHGIPVVILFPEIEFDEAKFIARVDALVKEHGYCTVVVSEGAHHADGTFLAEQGTRDAFGHAQLGGAAPVVANMVKNALGHKFHWAVADYLQRAARHIASKTDVRQAYELGKRAVELALKGRNAVMPTIERTSDVPYRYRIGVADLADVANVEKFMPRDFISADGFVITEKCRRYLRPLIAGEDYPAYRGGLPVYATLKNVAGRAAPRRRSRCSEARSARMRASRGGFGCRRDAGVAQLVEQRIRNAKVGSSTLLAGTSEIKGLPVSGPFAFGPQKPATHNLSCSPPACSTRSRWRPSAAPLRDARRDRQRSNSVPRHNPDQGLNTKPGLIATSAGMGCRSENSAG